MKLLQIIPTSNQLNIDKKTHQNQMCHVIRVKVLETTIYRIVRNDLCLFLLLVKYNYGSGIQSYWLISFRSCSFIEFNLPWIHAIKLNQYQFNLLYIFLDIDLVSCNAKMPSSN